MRIQGQYAFGKASVEEVWNALNRPEVIAKALPGCERFDIIEEGMYSAVIVMGISVIKGRYNVNIAISDSQRPSSFVLNISAEGSVGFLRIHAPISIKGLDDGSGALVDWEAEGEVGGLIAGVGNRILAGVAKRLVEQFFKSVESQIMLAGSAQT
ncbi:MAG TPA: carbon monoxide dehydrogenase subunit G [Firmicutes bacterium]|nr:carbon monoxide dehydrogenase subunit G [Bacillota bacterium]